MNKFKKALPFLIAFGFMSPLKAAAESLSYGVKVGFATSFSRCNDKKNELFNLLDYLFDRVKQSQWSPSRPDQFDHCVKEFQQIRSLLGQQVMLDNIELDSRMWNPSFGAALYIEYAFNDHIGLGAELLYNRFDALLHVKLLKEESQFLQQLGQLNGIPLNECKIQRSFDTIGLPMLLTWYWTAAIRPDFKDDYFLGRLFMGVHPFYLVARTHSVLYEVDGKTKKEDISFPKDDQRFKIGFIGGTSLEFPSALLLEIKAMLPYNLMNKEDKGLRPNVASFHLSFGYNFAKFIG